MSDIKNEYEKLKELIQPQNIADRISVWEDHTKVSAPYNALKQAVTIIRHFETTIESQKEEIKLMKGNIEGLTQTIEDKAPYAAQQYWNWLLGKGKDDLENEIESLKAITELAVKGLKEIACLNVDSAYSAGTIARKTYSEIERLQNGTTS